MIFIAPAIPFLPSIYSLIGILKPGPMLYIDLVTGKTKEGVQYSFRPRKFFIR